MRIALVNFESYDKLETTLQYLENIHNDVIGARVDLFCDDKVALDERLKENKFIHTIYPQKIDNLSITNFRSKYKSLRYYTKLNRYHIAIDTQNTWLSSVITYILAGHTAGIQQSTMKGKLLVKAFYDEYLFYDYEEEKKEALYQLFAKTFGFDKEYSSED